jgi:hypothetical protein
VSLGDQTEQQLRLSFEPPSLDEARRIIEPVHDARVLAAVIALAEGDLGRLRHFSEAAQSDFRDVLYWAEGPPMQDEPKSYEELRRRLRLPPESSR